MVEMYLKDGILFGRYSKNFVLDIETAKELVARRMELQNGQECALLLHLNGLKAESKEVRAFMATKGTEGISCGAFVVENFTERSLINFFLLFEKPQRPVKMFSNEQKALLWIKSLNLSKIDE